MGNCIKSKQSQNIKKGGRGNEGGGKGDIFLTCSKQKMYKKNMPRQGGRITLFYCYRNNNWY